MNIDELLRETAPDAEEWRPHTEQLRADVLARASARRRPTRRSLRAVAATVALATVGVCGVAYATGGVPDLVTQVTDQFGDDAGVAPADRPHPTQVVDLQLPDGSRFAAWHGGSDAMQCLVYTDRWDGSQITGTGAGMCSDGDEFDQQMIAWAENESRTTFYPIIVGDADDAAEVRITGEFAGTGEPVELTVPVDPATHFYSAVLPGTNDHPWAYHDEGFRGFRDSDDVTLEFLDAEGHVLRSELAPPS
ncbi:hypothetical protein ASC77_08465 [Nocardioides sp. Root1257]|uniref:hypothetical protein n=1 Tax=unclassified Nocardioides TaxID=2615069 RepID=UPI0006F34BC7|nr:MULTISPECIES: hypothetical protein [unclassified Nocardioides]KQW48758.1 hypothetical protein ASC77_08465 [Nocardioides sp. Root1257]KRC47933.1 hypothetical protein ASE24_08470 [Nocardioides sp. Root224]